MNVQLWLRSWKAFNMVRLLLYVFFIFAVFSFVTPAQSNALNKSADIHAIISNVIKPGFAAFHKSAISLQDRINALCAAPDQVRLIQSRSAFGVMVQKWGAVEMYRIGPLISDNRLERLLFWPDRRGRGLKQVKKAIRTNDISVQNVDTLSQKSVALQGLLALEYVLFGTDSHMLSEPNGFNRCAYASALSTNIRNIAQLIYLAWQSNSSDSIAELWQNPSNTNPLFRDSREQLAALFKLVGDGSDIIRIQRIDPILGKSFENIKPKSALFWRSGNTLRLLLANIEGLDAIMASAALAKGVNQNDKRIIDSLFFEFANAKRAFNVITPVFEQLGRSEETYNRLHYLTIVLNSLSQILRNQISPIFNLSSGFSSLDGD